MLYRRQTLGRRRAPYRQQQPAVSRRL